MQGSLSSSWTPTGPRNSTESTKTSKQNKISIYSHLHSITLKIQIVKGMGGGLWFRPGKEDQEDAAESQPTLEVIMGPLDT